MGICCKVSGPKTVKLQLTVLKSKIVCSLEQSCVCRLRLPDKSAMSRFRLSLDVGFMLWRRAFQHSCRQKGQPLVHYLLWDSSPQFDRDYEMVLLESVSRAALGRLRTTVWLTFETLSLPRWLGQTTIVNVLHADLAHPASSCSGPVHQ